ncbi:MAG: M20/M25/M40 family metallo-hydrolase [Planctomycetota bacterium]|nr:MAG: M20/M25/M40 family metallo-hydrolase [Planctomycetota bacterium]
MVRIGAGGLAATLVLEASLAFAGGASSVTGPDIQQHVSVLADDAMEGRGTASRGERLAADYIIGRLASYGLRPGAGDAGWLQPFEVAARPRLQGTPRLRLEVGPWHRELEWGRDANPFGFSASFAGEVPLVFVGYGISDPEAGYDDYAGIDVRGKAVVVLRHQPREGQGPLGRGALFSTKAAVAKAHGAVAMLLVTDPLNHPRDDTVLPFGGGGAGDAGIAAVHLRKNVAEGLFRLAGLDLVGLQRAIDEAGKPRSQVLPARCSLSLRVERAKATAHNVIGVLPGSDPTLKDQVVVVGAHYDHLGRGRHGGSLAQGAAGQIHNGADDNASGTAGLLELAQALADQRPRRTVCFVAFSGEERGLLGSAYFVKHPPFPRERIVAMLNLDMIGRLREDRLEVGGVGTSPGFAELVRAAAAGEGLKVQLDPSGYGPSDHASFAAAKVPVLFFFTGLHDDYHRPSDDPETVNAAGAARVARVAYRCLEALANAPKRPVYVEVPRKRRRGPRAYVGVVTGADPRGLALREVVPQSPAARAGLKVGDVLTRFGERPVASLRDLRAALRERKPGDAVKLSVLRHGEALELELTLGER